jgi:hypothetical protein
MGARILGDWREGGLRARERARAGTESLVNLWEWQELSCKPSKPSKPSLSMGMVGDGPGRRSLPREIIRIKIIKKPS